MAYNDKERCEIASDTSDSLCDVWDSFCGDWRAWEVVRNVVTRFYEFWSFGLGCLLCSISSDQGVEIWTEAGHS